VQLTAIKGRKKSYVQRMMEKWKVEEVVVVLGEV